MEPNESIPFSQIEPDPRDLSIERIQNSIFSYEKGFPLSTLSKNENGQRLDSFGNSLRKPGRFGSLESKPKTAWAFGELDVSGKR
ncbi:hypothetical protein LEP1GSC188_0856 [Leptospira weilii serovar Topaz str. LT2116]|uniref:Uncharacterized protein n=1 Tax=Leptospira weilii serovar Topaz str. LT2116 TaxID=1088540 RepID=M3FNX5_9LEPT|nr:hypothetical protein LEP1GSC188_0856 [Leptospira weilii serovar Topaz str. LT2116]